MKILLSFKKSFILLTILLLTVFYTQAATITSTATGGTWSTGTTWVGGVAPIAGDLVIIATTGTSVVSLSVSSGIIYGSLTVNTGSKLSISTRTLLVGGTVSNAGAITLSTGRITQSGTGNFTNSGTIVFTGAGRLSFTGNLTNTGTMTLVSAIVNFVGANSASSTVSGLTTTGAVNFQRTAGTVTFTGNVNGAAFTLSGNGGILNLGAGLTHTFTGAITLTAGTLNGGSSNLKANLIGTAWSYNAGTYTAGTGTITFAGAGAQTITGTLTSTFNNLILGNTGLKTLTRIPIINGILSMEGTATVSVAPTFGAASTIQYKGTGARAVGLEFPATFAGTGGIIIDQGVGSIVTLNASKTALAGNLNIKSGTFDLSAFTVNRVSAGGTLTVVAGASLKIGGTNSLPSNYSTHNIDCLSNIEYTGAAQTIALLNTSQIYGNLILSGSGIKTLQTGTTSICGNLTTSGTATVTGVVGLTIGGNVDIQAGSTFAAGAFTHNIGANWTVNGTFVATGSTINFNGLNAGSIGVSNFNNITFSGAGVKNATGALTVTGNLSITNNLKGGSFTHSVSGNWSNDGLFSEETSTIIFTNSTVKSLNGTSPTTFYNLTMNGTGGINLGNGPVVSGTLTLTSGIISLGIYNLSAGAVSGGSATSYVKTNSTGVLIRSVTTGTETAFPVGNSAYDPITLTNTTVGNIDNYQVRVLDVPVTNANSTKTINRKWQLTETVAGGSALTIAAVYNTADGSGVGFNAGVLPVFGYFNGTGWSAPLAATSAGTNPNTYTSAFGAFTSNDLTNSANFISLGSGDAFNASKLIVKSISPASPYTSDANVSVTVQSENSNNVLTNVSANTSFGLTAANTVLSGVGTGTLSANTYETTLSNLTLTGTTTSATITATRSSGDVLTAGTSALFSVILGTIYKPSVSGNWSTVQWQISTDGGNVYSNTTLPVNNIFGTSDVILVPAGIILTADVSTASFYNFQVDGTLILGSGTLTLNHTVGGGDYGFQVFGTFQQSGGTFTNSNTIYPIVFKGGTYIHAINGGSIPVAAWSSLNSTQSTCQITGISNTAISSGMNQLFQNFTWNNASQSVIQNLSADLTVSGALNLTNGVITTGIYSVILNSVGSLSILNNARINGKFRRFIPNATNQTYTFPIGDATYYTPVTITFSGTTAGSGYLDAFTSVGQPPLASGLSQTKYINRNWTLSNVGISGFTSYSSTFAFVDGDKVGTPTPLALVVRKLTGTTWSTTTTGSQSANATQCTGLTSFSSFSIGEENCSSTNAIWFGGTNTDWNTGSNWCNGSVPTSAVDIIIPSGPANQPIISSAASCKNISIETGSTLTVNGSPVVSIYGNWSLGGTFTPGTGTLSFVGASPQTISGLTAFTNLTINNASGVTAVNNITVSGILNLQSDNASTTKGSLDMSLNTLNMGVDATTIGIGDVTGIITRTHSFATATFYSFGNVNSGVLFAELSGQTLPTSVSLKVSIGTAPVWNSGNSSGTSFPLTPLSRIYDVIQTGGSGTSALLRVHYRDNEIMPGLNESNLTLWHRIFTGGSSYFVTEVGKSNQDVTANFLAIQDIDVVNIPSIWGHQQEAIAPTQASILTWVGGTTGATTDWRTSTNWDPAAIPSPNYKIVIPDAASTGFDPILPAGNDSCVSVLIETGGILNTAAGANLVLTGTDAVWLKETGGTFNAGTSTVKVSSAVDFASFTGSTDFYNLTISDGARLRPASNSYTGILGTLYLSSTGVLDAVTTENTFEFKGTSQSIPNPNGSTTGYHHLIVSGIESKTLPVVLDVIGNFTNNGTVDAITNNSTVNMNGAVAQTIGGSSSTTFNNLTINNATGVNAGNNITVNGILHLASSNPSDTKAALDMVTNWNDYPGTTNLNPGINNMVSYYLNMGTTATTTGIGDVTGIVKRSTIASNTPYTFGNQFTTVTLTDATGVNGLTVTIKIGSLPGHIHTTDAVKRHYEIIPLVTDPETFTSSARVAINFHYLDSELNGNSESKLTTADYDIDGGASEPDEHGRASFDFTNNYVGLNNIPISYYIKKTGHIWRTIFFLRDYQESQKTWNGSLNSDWRSEFNWTPEGTPSIGSMIVIPNALTTAFDPVLPTGSTTINTMTIESGGILTMGSNTLVILNSLSAGWEDQNTLGNDPGTSTVVFAKPGAIVSGFGRFYNVSIADTATVAIQTNSTMSIGNTITKTGTGNGKFYVDNSDCTVNYDKEGAQTIILPDGLPAYHNLIVSGSGVKTLPTFPLSIHTNLTLLGTVSVAPSNNLSIGENLNIGVGTSFSAGSYIHTIAGNLINNGTFNGTGSTINLNGAVAQLIDGTSAPSFTNLILSNSAASVTTNVDLSCSGFFTNSGTLDMASNVLTVTGTTTNTGILKTAVPSSTSTTPLPSGKIWGGTVEYSGNGGSQTLVNGIYNNLSMTGSSGAIATSDITVSGLLTLSASNPTSTRGLLDMASYTLEMGLTGTTLGIGDVTGLIKRTGTFLGNIPYSFGHENSTITFTNVDGSTKPTWISSKIVIGSAPGWRGTGLKRYYSFAIDGGTDRTIVKLHYLDTELDPSETDESKLIYWDAYTGPTFSNFYPRGKTTINTDNNWIGLTGMAINFFAPSSTLDYKQWGLGYTNVSVIRWTGNGSASYPGDWSLPGNWSGGVPTASDAVLIPALADLPVDTHGLPYRNLNPTIAPAVAKQLEIAPGATLTVDSYDITITGTEAGEWKNNGTFIPGTGTVIFDNENAVLLGTTNFNNVSITSNAFLTLQNNTIMHVGGTLTNTGALEATLFPNTVEYNGADQTVLKPNGTTPGYYNLSLSGSGSKTMPLSALNILADFSLSGTTSVTPNASLTIGGNATFGSGTFFTAGNHTHTVGGNFTNNGGSFNSAGSTVLFNGNSIQTIGGSASTSFDHFTINNIAGALLGINETVGGTLTLTNGLITTGSFSLTVSQTGSITGESSSSYINGKLVEIYSTTGSKIFPIGKGGNYRPLTLNYTALTGTSSVTAEQMETALPGNTPNNIVSFEGRYWNISQTGGSNFTYFVTLDGTGWSPTGAPKIIKGDGVTNAFFDVKTPDYTNNTVFNSFGYFGLGSYFTYISWLGLSSDNSWFTTSNWSSASVPTSTDSVRIPSSLTYYPVIGGTSPGNDVLFSGTGKLQVQDGASITVQNGPLLKFESGVLVTTGIGSKIILESGARYINLSAGIPTLEFQRQLTGTQGWRMVASPLTSKFSEMFKAPLVTQGFTDSNYPSLQPNLMWWDETDGGTTLQGWREPTNITDNTSAGRGYFHYLFNGAGRLNLNGTTTGFNYSDVLPITMSVTGVENFNGSGSYDYNLTYTAHDGSAQTPSPTDTTYYDLNSLDQGWNLIGNPTASTLNWDATGLAWTKTNVDNTIYIWDPSALSGNGDYLTWNGTTGSLGNGKISPFQAFWVHSTAPTTLSFTNAAKSESTSTFLRNSVVDETLTIPITLSENQMQTSSYITFSRDGIAGPDSWDAYRLEPMSDTWLKLYTLSAPDFVSPLVINNLPLPEDDLINIPLYVDAQVNGTTTDNSFTLQWNIPENWPSNWNISLLDHQNEQAISMTENAEYKFNQTSLTNTSAVTNQLYLPNTLVQSVPKIGLLRSSKQLPPFSIVISKRGAIEYMAPKPQLISNYPNPFKISTTIRFSLPVAAKVQLDVYDSQGIKVSSLADGQYSAGISEIQWQPKSKSPGMYFIRFISGETLETKKTIFIN